MGQLSTDLALRDHRLDIQGLRAVAVLVVVAFHAGLPVPGGFVGVDVFFVISGYVIAGMLERQWSSTGRIKFGQFYLRRFRRLTPALAAVIVATIIGSALVLSPLGPQQTAAKTGIGALFLCANIVIAKTTGGYFDADAHLNPLLHTWSLSVEEQFYLLFPWLIALCWYGAARRGGKNYLPHLCVALIAVVSFGLTCGGTDLLNAMGASSLTTGTYSRWAQTLLGFYSPVTRSWEFAVGVLLALSAPRLFGLSQRVRIALHVVGLALLAVSLWAISGATPFPSAWTLLPVLGTALLIAGGVGGTNAIVRALSSRAMVKIGDWSYSIYLWHWPFIVFAELLWPHDSVAPLVAAAASFLPAIASYRWVENPIRTLSMSNVRQVVRVVGPTMSIPLLLSVAIYVGANRGYGSEAIRSMQLAVLTPHAVSTTRCAASNLAAGGPDAACTFNQNATGRPLFLIGDSTAWHFSEAAIGAAETLGRPLTIVNTPAGCPVKDVYVRFHNAPSYRDAGACRQGYDDVMQWLGRQQSGTVIIADINGTYRDEFTAVGSAADALVSDVRERIRVLDAGLESTIAELRRYGQSVLLVEPLPDFEYPQKFDPLRCGWHTLVDGSCVAQMPRAEADSIQQPQLGSLRSIAARTGTQLWDPRELVCSAETCSTERSGTNLYRDAFHISPAASRLLTPSLVDALNSVG